mgnify:CR=1 FL=1
MSISSRVLQERAVSAFPISIGTALALESILDGIQPPYDPEREIPERIDLNQYQEFWINIETVYRNILGSVPTAVQSSLLGGEILEVMEEEVELIQELVNNATAGRMKVMFYRNDQKGLARAHPHAVLRKPKTDKQITYQLLCDNVCNAFLKHNKGKSSFAEYDRLLKPLGKPKALIITHQAYDLLSEKFFDELDLLESHTGVLKKRSLWHTKLSDGKNLVRIPVNVCTMQVFGDSVTFSPQPMALRQQVIELSEKFEWHALTTKDRLRLSFGTLKDHHAGSVLSAMLGEI